MQSDPKPVTQIKRAAAQQDAPIWVKLNNAASNPSRRTVRRAGARIAKRRKSA